MKNRKILILALGIVVALILGIAVAYAALSSTLTAKFNSVMTGNASWDVGFSTNGVWASGTNGISGNNNGPSGAICGHANISKNSITIDSTTLAKPGDSCSYGFEVENKGSIDAKISSIIANQPTSTTCIEKSISETEHEMVCGNITYNIQLTSGNDKIPESSYSWCALKVTYTGTDLSTTPITHTNPGFTLVFGQA